MSLPGKRLVLLLGVVVLVAAVVGIALAVFGNEGHKRAVAKGPRPADVASTAGIPGFAAPDPDAVAAYWTPERIASARPYPRLPGSAASSGPATDDEVTTHEMPGVRPPGVSVAPAQPVPRAAAAFPQLRGYPYNAYRWKGSFSRLPARVHGKVIFCDPSEGPCSDRRHNPWECSGTVINTDNKSVVITAGHCVYNNETGTWMKNWSFYPGYKHGKHPRYGVWPYRTLYTPSLWQRGNDKFDIGAAVLVTAGSRGIVDVVGAEGWQTGPDSDPGRRRVRLWGYPLTIATTSRPRNYNNLRVCETRQGRRSNASSGSGPAPYAVGCDMLGGSSGGGWVKDYSDSQGWGRVFSVNSSGPDDRPLMYGPVFGRRALSLISEAGK
jgi:hypothetical protein